MPYTSFPFKPKSTQPCYLHLVMKKKIKIIKRLFFNVKYCIFLKTSKMSANYYVDLQTLAGASYSC